MSKCQAPSPTLFPEVSADYRYFICLAGTYGPYEIWVDLETGEVLGPKPSWDWRWDEYEIPESYLYPYN